MLTMTRLLTRSEQQMLDLMLKQLNPELRIKMENEGGHLTVDLDKGNFEVVGCDTALAETILNDLKRRRY
jgi:hypothetical protein